MNLLPRSMTLALALSVLVAPACAARRARHPESSLRRPQEAVRWLRTSHGPRLVTGQTNHELERMSRDPHSFLAGAGPLVDHDLSHHWAWAAHPPGPTVVRVGNATAHNLGTMRDGRGLSVYDWFSMDHAGPGNAMSDLRQWLVSVTMVGHELAFDDADVSGVLLESMRTYRDGIARLAGHPHARDWAMTAERGNTYTRRMLNIASHRRREDVLNRWTVVGHHGRRFKLEDEFVSIEPHQAHSYWTALQAMKTEHRPASYWLVKDAVVRSEDGQHRGPHHHVYLLIEGPTASLVDDFVLEAYQPAQASRHVQWAAWQLRRAPEPFYGVLEVDGHEFMLREVQPEMMPFAEGRIEGLDDYYDLGRAGALLLARAHAVTAASADELRAFAADWSANPHGIEAGLGHFAMRYAEQVRADHEQLVSHWTPRHTLVKPHSGRRRVKVSTTTTTAPGKPAQVDAAPVQVPIATPPPAPPAPTPAPPPDGHKVEPAGPPPATPVAPPATLAPPSVAPPLTPEPPPPIPGGVPQPLQPPDEGR